MNLGPGKREARNGTGPEAGTVRIGLHTSEIGRGRVVSLVDEQWPGRTTSYPLPQRERLFSSAMLL